MTARALATAALLMWAACTSSDTISSPDAGFFDSDPDPEPEPEPETERDPKPEPDPDPDPSPDPEVPFAVYLDMTGLNTTGFCPLETASVCTAQIRDRVASYFAAWNIYVVSDPAIAVATLIVRDGSGGEGVYSAQAMTCGALSEDATGQVWADDIYARSWTNGCLFDSVGDLASVIAHSVGHILGMPDNANSDSIMSPNVTCHTPGFGCGMPGADPSASCPESGPDPYCPDSYLDAMIGPPVPPPDSVPAEDQ